MTNDKKARGLAILFTVTYMVSYMTRINFGAIISEIESDTQISRTLLSMLVTGGFITYGIGQIVSGLCGDYFSPKRLVKIGLTVSVIMNLLMMVSSHSYLMLAVWCINGFAQAFMWPPIVKIMVEVFSEYYYKKMAVRISWASSYGTIIIYFFAPIIITLFNWRFVFLFSAICGIVTIFIWDKYCIDIKKISPNNTIPDKITPKSVNYILFSPIVIGIMIAIILQGMLRDGVTTWMPSYIADTYHLGSAVSILTGIVLPLFSIICTQISSSLYRKRINNPITCSVIMFLIGTVVAIILYCCSGSSAIISIICSAVLTGAMHGVSSMLTAMVPPFFKKHGNVSTVTGILNACAYVGSGISTFIIALLSEKIGWQINLFIWCIIAIVGSLLCFSCIKPWKHFFQEKDSPAV